VAFRLYTRDQIAPQGQVTGRCSPSGTRAVAGQPRWRGLVPSGVPGGSVARLLPPWGVPGPGARPHHRHGPPLRGTARPLNGQAAFPTKLVLAPADDGVLQAYRVAMVKPVARDPAAGVLLALSAVFMLTGAALVVLVSRAGWGLLAVGVLLSGAAVVKVLLGAAR